MPKAWTHGPTKENWEQQKSTIHRLYVVDNLTLQGVLSELAKLGLNATKPQLEYKLKKWGFKKKLSQDEWRLVDRETTKRKLEDKETDLIYSGKRLKSATIKKARQRYGHSDHVVSENNALVLPQELTICTPPFMSIEFSGWPETLPWLTFVSKQDAFLKNVSSQLHARFLSSARSSTSEAEPYKSLVRILPTGLTPERSRSAPLQLAAVFSKSMPEVHVDEHVQRAQAILKGEGENCLLEHIKLIIYNASNNLSTFDSYPYDGYDDYDDYEWDATVGMLREGGILDIKLNIKTTQDETLLAFFETLFKQAIRRANSTNKISYESGMEVLRWLLKSGIDLDQEEYFGQVPLQYCLDRYDGDLNLIQLLVESGANPGLVKLKEGWVGSSSDYYMKARFLFERGAVADSLDKLLHMALRERDLDFASTLISRHHADPASILKQDYPHQDILHEESALCVAAEAGMEEVNLVLHHLHLRYPSIPLPTFITPDAYIAAAYLGSEDVTRLFLELDPSALHANILGITALHVAAAEGHYGVCQLLLPRLSNAAFLQQYPAPLHLAIRSGHRAVMQLLIENGADVNSKGTSVIFGYSGFLNQPLTPLQEAMQCSRSSSCISDLLSAGADYSGVAIYEAAKSSNEELIFSVLTASTDPNMKDDGSAIALQRILRADNECVLDHPKFKALARSLLDTEVQLLEGEIVGAIRRGWWDIVASLTANRGLIDTDIYGRTTIEGAIMSASCLPKFMDDVFEAYRYSYEPGSLCAAVWEKNLPFVKRLLASRPENRPPDVVESTALGLAAALGLSEIAKELLAVLPMSPALIPLDSYFGVTRIEDKAKLKDANDLTFWHWNLGSKLANGSPLTLAALASSPELFNSLLKHGYQSDPLTWLVCVGKKTTEMLELLLDHGQRISRNDTVFYAGYRMSNPLSIAIRSPMAQQSVKLLLRAGEGMNPSWVNDDMGYGTPLQQAIKESKTDVISELLEAGANINARPGGPGGETALELAIEKGDVDIINTLLEAGADVNSGPRHKGRTALQLAIEKGDVDIIDNLLEAGADVNSGPRHKGRTALQLAIEKGDVDIIDNLLKAGADVNSGPRHKGRTALQLAIEKGDVDIIDNLLKAGADVNSGPRYEGRTALQLAIEKGDVNIINTLLKAGAGINSGPSDLSGGTALQLAVKNGDMDIIDNLLKAGADVNSGPSDISRGTALQLAVKNGDMDIIDNLLKAGADINASPGKMHGATALQFAAMNGHIGLAKYLLELCAFVNAPRSPFCGRTALEGAAEHGRLDMVRLLLEKGALVHNRGRRQYVRAVGFAIKRGHLVVAELLKAHGDWANSDQQMLERDYGGYELKWGERLWGDDIGQMPRVDEDSEMSDLTEEIDSPEDVMSIAERDGAASEGPEDRFPDAPTAVVEVVEDSNAPDDDDVVSAIHSWLNGGLTHSTPT